MPNLCTVRGDKPRLVQRYLSSLDTVRKLGAQLLITGHGDPIRGAARIRADLDKMHAAVSYVNDATVAGMNAGKDVHTLMQEIKLPADLDVGEGYGRVSWSVRGIYEGYAGWFTGDPADMFPKGRESVSADLVQLAGGPSRIAQRAMELLRAGKPIEALNLTSVGLEGAPSDRDVLRARLEVLTQMAKTSDNRNEQGWLNEGLARAQKALGQ